MKNSFFYQQAELVVRLLPIIFKEQCFALKGGTAINFFIRELPRLSIDIDLVYLPIRDRKEAIHDIKSSLNRCSDAIEKALPGVQVKKQSDQKEAGMKLVVRYNGVSVKIEPNFIIRGTVFVAKEIDFNKISSRHVQSICISAGSVYC
ncbi:MAG: nucleotidyl transferase AbiEii/AbiGii toxin family protein [Endomicrobiales bacterium]